MTHRGTTFYPVPNQGIYQTKIQCVGCKDEFVMLATGLEVYNYVECDALAQVAFPNWSDDERELLISQTCGKCWEEIVNQ